MDKNQNRSQIPTTGKSDIDDFDERRQDNESEVAEITARHIILKMKTSRRIYYKIKIGYHCCILRLTRGQHVNSVNNSCYYILKIMNRLKHKTSIKILFVLGLLSDYKKILY